jgi:hypothetical protein
MTGKEIEQINEELNERAEMDGGNHGDVCRMLTQISDYPNYVSEDFLKALHKEIKLKHTYYKKNYEIVKVERPISYTHTCYELKRKS